MKEITEQSVLSLSVTNDAKEVSMLAERIEDFCAAQSLTPAVIHAVNLSLDELLTNTINYGYTDSDEHVIEVSIRLEPGVIIVQLVDDGIAFDPFALPPPDIDAPLETRPIGGLGVFFVRQLMTDVDYRRVDGRNIVTLTKRIGATSATEA